MKVTFVEVPEDNKVDVHIDDVLIRRPINTTKDGQRYIYVPNMYHPAGGRYSFLHRPGDMVQAMRAGYGDAIEVGHLMVRTEHLVRFLDREYGEQIRAKSLEGWENTEFAWVVSERCGIMGDVPLTVADMPRPIHTKGDARTYPIKYYGSEAEAQAFIDSIAAELMPKIEHYRSLSTVEEKNEYYNMEMAQYSGLKESIILKITDDDRRIPLSVQQVVRTSSVPAQKLFIHYIEHIGIIHAYMCRGDAINADSDFIRMIKTGTLYFTSSMEDLFKNEASLIYRLAADDRRTNWFSELQDIFDSDEYQDLLKFVDENGCGCIAIEEAFLHKQQLFPISPTVENPYEAIVHEGTNGLVVFANLNPDEVGSRSKRRKAYFPDRSCAAKICAGTVRITGVKDKGKYGFFTGEMVSYESPSEEKLAEWILKESNKKVKIPTTVIQFIKNPLWGDAICLHNLESASDTYCIKDFAGGVTICNLLDIYDHSKDEIVEEISVEDFICTGYAGATKVALCNMVPHVYNHPERDGSEISTKFISDDFDLAVDCGLIILLKLKSIIYCRICQDRMYKAASILCNDLIPVLEKAAEINRSAIEQFDAKRKKGKM